MFTHIDSDQRPTMVDVSEKVATLRQAKARVELRLPKEIAEGMLVASREIPLAPFKKGGNSEIFVPKGPVFQTAIIAGMMAVKRTHELIPFCHPLPIEKCRFTIVTDDFPNIVIECEVAVTAKTGVEMEALTGASIAALTVYDMCKSFSHDIVIGPCTLLEKSGGKSDFFERA